MNLPIMMECKILIEVKNDRRLYREGRHPVMQRLNTYKSNLMENNDLSKETTDRLSWLIKHLNTIS